MPTLTHSVTGVGTSGNWVNPANAGAADGVYATRAPVRRTPSTSYLKIDPFTDLPVAAVVTAVRLRVKSSVTALSTVTLNITVYNGTATAITTSGSWVESTTQHVDTFTVSATIFQLKQSTLQVRLVDNMDDSTASTINLDHMALEVDYELAAERIRTVAAEYAAGYPTSGSTVVDTTGGTSLVVLLYSNATWAGPDPTVTYAGAALTQRARYDSTAAGYQTVFVFSAEVTPNATGALAHSQTTQTYNSERHLHAHVMKEADLANLLVASVTRAANVSSFVASYPTATPPRTLLAAGYGYYLNNAPSISAGTYQRTEVAALTAGSAADSRGYVAYGQGAGSFTWACDSWNYAMATTVSIPRLAPATGPVYRVWNGTAQVTPTSMGVWNGTELVPIASTAYVL